MAPPLIRRNVAAHLGRGALLAVVVIISTTFVVGSMAFSRHVGDVLGAAGAAVDPAAAEAASGTVTVSADLGGSTTPTAVSEDLLEVIGTVPGVATASGTFDQPVSFALRREEQPDRPVQLRGLVFSSAFDDTWELVDGRAPRGADEIAVDLGGAAAGVTFLGDRTDIQLPTGTRDVDVVGLVRRPGDDAVPTGAAALSDAHAVFDATVIAPLLAAEGSFDRVTVIADGSVPLEDLVGNLRDELPDDLVVTELVTGAGATQHTVSTLDDAVRSATLGFAAVSVVVAIIVIANVWSVIVARRTRELALLRILGASRRRLLVMVLAESSAIGVGAAAVGALIGAWLGRVAAAGVAESDVSLPFVLDPSMLATALVVGAGVTVLGSLGPARRASSVAPLAALDDGFSPAVPSSWWRRLFPSAAVLIGLAMVLRWRAEPSGSSALGVIGATILVVGAAGWSRRVVAPALGAADAVFGRTGAVTRLALGNARRDPRRTAAAASTLIVGMTLVASVATVGASIRETLTDRFSTASSADFFVERRGLVRVDADSLFAAIDAGRAPLSAAAEVIAVDGVIRGDAATERRVVTADLGRIGTVVDLGVTEGSLEGDVPGVAVSSGAADRLDTGVGDEVELVSVSGRTTSLPVLAVYDDTSVYGPVVVDRDSVASVDAEGTFELLALSFDDRAPTSRVRRFLDSVAGEFPKVRVHDPVEFDRLNTSVADTVLRIVAVLLVGSLGMGAVGLSATVALGVIERRRELALLRVIGAERANLMSMVRTESLFIALVAGIIGMAVGVGLATVGLLAAPPEVVSRVVVPWIPLAVVEVVAAVLGVLAALAPARRAAATSPLDALRDS